MPVVNTSHDLLWSKDPFCVHTHSSQDMLSAVSATRQMDNHKYKPTLCSIYSIYWLLEAVPCNWKKLRQFFQIFVDTFFCLNRLHFLLLNLGEVRH